LKITLLISCKDQKGIISKVTDFIHKNEGNITYLDQFVERDKREFFMRLESEFANTDFNIDSFKDDFINGIGNKLNFSFELFKSESKKKMAIFVSKYEHCIYDVLSRYKAGELNVEIPLIVSNHKKLSHVADIFGIPFHHIKHNRDCKDKAQDKQIKLLEKYNIDFIVLARYMQIIGEDITAKYPNKIINIHHSFLPAFAGAKPYHSAFNRGVKIIGATSHYVINELDAGPIIEQSTKRVSHLNSIEDLIIKGRDLEKIVLSRAITLHIQNKILVSNNKTIIFS
jgi:formyltetrahydrofolate deformylase